MFTRGRITQNLPGTIFLQLQKNRRITTFGKGQGLAIGKEYVITIILHILPWDQVEYIEIDLTEQIRDNLIN